MQKKITKHTIGPMHPNIVGICNKIQEKTKKIPKFLELSFPTKELKGASRYLTFHTVGLKTSLLIGKTKIKVLSVFRLNNRDMKFGLLKI